ncbi:MAG: hypothetical protein ABI348_04610 [Nitrososphaera sp.]|jgi:hypothetical protein
MAAKDVAQDIILRLREVFGESAFAIFQDELEADYLGNELSLEEAIASRPELFERALETVLGPGGLVVLAIVLEGTRAQFHTGKDYFSYSKVGDLSRCVALLARNSSSVAAG